MASSLLRLGRLGTLKCLQLESWSILRTPNSTAFCTKTETPQKPAKKVKAASKILEASDEKAFLHVYKTAVAFPVKFSISAAESVVVADKATIAEVVPRAPAAEEVNSPAVEAEETAAQVTPPVAEEAIKLEIPTEAVVASIVTAKLSSASKDAVAEPSGQILTSVKAAAPVDEAVTADAPAVGVTPSEMMSPVTEEVTPSAIGAVNSVPGVFSEAVTKKMPVLDTGAPVVDVAPPMADCATEIVDAAPTATEPLIAISAQNQGPEDIPVAASSIAEPVLATASSSEPEAPAADYSSSSSSSDSDSDSDSDSEKTDMKSETPLTTPVVEKTKATAQAETVVQAVQDAILAETMETPEGFFETNVEVDPVVDAETTVGVAPETVAATPVLDSSELVDPAPVLKAELSEVATEAAPTMSSDDLVDSAPEISRAVGESATETEVSTPEAVAEYFPEIVAEAASESLIATENDPAPEVVAETIAAEATVEAAPASEADASLMAAQVDNESEAVTFKTEAAQVKGVAEDVPVEAVAVESADEQVDIAPVVAEAAGEELQAEAPAESPEEAAVAPPEPEPFDNTTYKNKEHHHYNPFTFADLDLEMAKYRLPQPSSGRPSPRH